jgi:hypothetical protein
MNYYCTLFDSNYLTRGLALYDSLEKTGTPFMLYVFAFDDLAADILDKLSFAHLTVIRLQEFEDERLLAVKSTRSRGEYCWTCSSFSILYVLRHFDVPEVTYLDSDLYFFQSPQILLDEFHAADKDVLITAHRYTPEYDQSETSGIYCVQFMTFRNTENGLRVLNWWCDRCEEWCYARFEDGKFGDQKYLDDWPARFPGMIHELKHIGGGLAPWNVQQYHCTEGPRIDHVPVVFYHFHELKWLSLHTFDMGPYRLSKGAVKYIYTDYFKALKKALKNVQERYDIDFSRGFIPVESGILSALRRCKRMLSRMRKGNYNVVRG